MLQLQASLSINYLYGHFSEPFKIDQNHQGISMSLVQSYTIRDEFF